MEGVAKKARAFFQPALGAAEGANEGANEPPDACQLPPVLAPASTSPPPQPIVQPGAHRAACSPTISCSPTCSANVAPPAASPSAHLPAPAVRQAAQHLPASAASLAPMQRRTLKQAQKRAKQRWCRWLSATKSRIGGTNGMRQRLGKKRWKAFVEYANEHFQPHFVNKFSAPMRCCGPLGKSATCPNGGYAVDPTVEADVKTNLATLHLDHARDLTAICEAWKEAMPARLATWHDGVDKDLVCQLLFGVEDHARAATSLNPDLWKANVSFRCGASKQHRAGAFCHDMWGSHAMQWPITADMLRA